MALLAAWCAMRLRELADLRGGDMDLRTNRGEGPQASGARRREFIVGPPKSNAGVRDVAIPPHLVPLDKDHLKNLTARVGMRCCSRQRPTTTCTLLRRRSTRSTTRPGRPRSRGPALADLRYSGAVLAAQTGATLAELMGRLGHSTPGAAMRYQHAAADRDAEIARRLSELVRE